MTTELDRLISAERSVPAAPAAQVERHWRRLGKAIDAGHPALDVATTPLELSAGVNAKWSALGAVSIVAAASAAAAASLAGAFEKTPAPATSSAVATASTSEVKARAARPAAPATPSQAPPLPAVPAPLEAPRDSPGLGAEVQLVRSAKQASDAGRFDAARALLDEHAREFPNGALALEREALRVLIACRSSPAAALARATEFLRQRPTAPLAEHIQRACGMIAPGSSDPVGTFPDVDK